jgi:hypothetical protein
MTAVSVFKTDAVAQQPHAMPAVAVARRPVVSAASAVQRRAPRARAIPVSAAESAANWTSF